MFVFYDCLWKLSIALLSVTFAYFRIVEYMISSKVDIEVTKAMAVYSQGIHIVAALLFVISLLSRNTFITVLTIATLICQSVFTYKHYYSRECTSSEVSFTATKPCTSAEVYFEEFNKELVALYMVAVAAVICVLCVILYANHLERCLQKITDMCKPTGEVPSEAQSPGDNPKTSVVSIPASTWSGRRELLILRSPRRDSGNFSV